MNIKLQRKLERQAKQQERLLTGYSLGVKKAKGTKFSTNRLWNHNNIDKSNEFEVVIGGKLYKKVIR